MKSTNLVLIAGPAASGKTTLKDKLLTYYNAYSFRPADAYIMLAKQLSIPIELAFSAVNNQDAETFFLRFM